MPRVPFRRVLSPRALRGPLRSGRADVLHSDRPTVDPRLRPAGNADDHDPRPVDGCDPRGPRADERRRCRWPRPDGRYHRCGTGRRFASWMSTYDVPYLVDGFQLVIVGLGIYAIPEIVLLLRRDRAISEGGALGDGWSQGLRDWWEHRWLSIRCAFIGVTVGVIPGLGGSVVEWLAYGSAVQTAKDRSKFGSGDIRGVIAPEFSNNAKEGGGLVPTLIFGIPGSGSMAVFLGGWRSST